MKIITTVLLCLITFFSQAQNLTSYNDSEKGYGYKNEKGQIVIPPKYEEVHGFSYGFAAVKLNEKWGFVDTTGKEVIPLQYDEVNEDFSKYGYARVRLTDYGFLYIDTKGKQCNFTRVYDMFENVAWVDFTSGGMGIIDVKTGKEIYKCNNCDGSLSFSNKGLLKLDYPEPMYIDKNGKEYYTITMPGFLVVYKSENGKYGFYKYNLSDKSKLHGFDLYSRVIFPAKYDTVYQAVYDDVGNEISYANRYLVEIAGKKGLVDSLGNEIVPVKYDWIDYGFSGGSYVKVKLNGKCGVVDKSGKEVISPAYFDIGKFSEGLVWVRPAPGGNFGYADVSGRLVIDTLLNYAGAGEFSEGLAIAEGGSVMDANGNEYVLYGYIDKTGKAVIPLKYTSAQQFKNGKAKVRLYDREFYIDKNGNEIK
ncbi:MAG: WG repeat-containing protein [Bacteroidia bacterium]|nr:WG repeat-containing protein [Bacteroidia bacterium]